MGYYTTYNLEIKENRSNLSEVELNEKLINELEKRDVLDYALDENLESTDGVKWYDHEETMRIISKKIPDVLFALSGEGEEQGDVWNKYFMNGKMHACHAEMIIPEFDESKMS